MCLPLAAEMTEEGVAGGMMAVIMEAEDGEAISEATGVASESEVGLSTSLLFDARELRLKQPMLEKVKILHIGAKRQKLYEKLEFFNTFSIFFISNFWAALNSEVGL